MDDDQSQFRIQQRVRHGPPLLNGDTAGVPNPYASSPYGGPLDTRLPFELGPGTGQLCSYLHAPEGTRTFERHDDPAIDPGLSYQNQSIWDSLAGDASLADWILAKQIQEIHSLENGQQTMPAALPIVQTRSHRYDVQVDQQFTPVVQPTITPIIPYSQTELGMDWHHNAIPGEFQGQNSQLLTNVPYLANWTLATDTQMDRQFVPIEAPIVPYSQRELGMDWHLNAIPSEFHGQNPQFLTNAPGDTIDYPVPYDVLLNINPMMNGQLQWEADQLNPDKGRSGLFWQKPLQWAPVEMAESYGKPKGNPDQIAKSRKKAKTKRYSHSNLTFRFRSKRPTPNAISPMELHTRDACVGCRVTKRKCNDVDLGGCCDRCRQSRLYCLTTKHLRSIWKLPELYTENQAESLIPSNAGSELPKIYRASIYVNFSPGKPNIPLPCKVSEHTSTFNGAPRSSMIWENLRNPKTDKNCVQKGRFNSCCIPRTCIPSPEKLLEWAVNSMQQRPSRVVKDFYGPLYTFTANYIRVASRPLYDLMALTLIHTAVYSVCHSSMTIVFDKRQHAHIALPLSLRAQICRPLFQLFEVTGAEIHQRLISALHGLPKNHRLAFRIVNWLLVLTYEHCLHQTSMEISLMKLKDEIPHQDLTERKNSLERIVKDLKNLHQIIFKKMPDFAHRDFEESWKSDENDEDDHELKDLLAMLRIAILEHQPPNISVTPGSLETLAPQLYHGITALEQNGYETVSEDTKTVSTSKKVDFDNMSADTGLSNGSGNKPLSRPQAIQKVLQNLKSQYL